MINILRHNINKTEKSTSNKLPTLITSRFVTKNHEKYLSKSATFKPQLLNFYSLVVVFTWVKGGDII